MTRLRPEQSAGSVLQAASVSANDAESNILVRLARYGQQNEFVTRYGDDGEDEFDGSTGTIPQRLLMMNGVLVHDKIKPDAFNGSTRIAWLAQPDDPHAVETAYLAVLTRRPTAAEEAHFESALADKGQTLREQRLEDLLQAAAPTRRNSPWNP